MYMCIYISTYGISDFKIIELDDGENLQESPIFDGKNHGFL